MADQIVDFAQQFVKHMPTVTTIGLGMALPLGLIYVIRRHNKEFALLACVCVAYAVTPFLPHF